MNKLLCTTVLLFCITSKEVLGDAGLESSIDVQNLSTTTPFININMKVLKEQVRKEMQIIRKDMKTELKQHLSNLGIRQHIQLKSRKRSIETLNHQISQLTQSVATQANIIELALIGTNERLKRLQSSINIIQESDIKGINENVIILQNNLTSTMSEIKDTNSRVENILKNINTVDSKVDDMKLNTKIAKSKIENIEEMMNSIKVQINYNFEDMSTGFDGLNSKFEDMKMHSTNIESKLENVNENIQKLNSSFNSENNNYVTLSTVVHSYNNLEERMKIANETCVLTQNAVTELNNKVGTIETRINSLNEDSKILPQYINITDNPDSNIRITSMDNTNKLFSILSNTVTHKPSLKESVDISSQYSSIRVNSRPYKINEDINEIIPTGEDTVRECDGSSFLISNQCFSVHRDRKRTWEEAQQRCAEDGMVIAQPKDPSALRRYLISNNMVDGMAGTFFWLGARGNGTNMVWNTSQQILPVGDPSWYRGHPADRLTSNHCLSMLARSSYFGSGKPGSPYRASECTWPFHILCQQGP